MIPNLTTEQRRENLEKAMRVRMARAELRADLKQGATDIRHVFELADSGHEEASGMRVKHLISAMPGYGFAKTRDLMRELGISESRRVRGVGTRQRAALLGVLA